MNLEYEAVIGLETHVQLKTKSKMFSKSSADYQSAEPNTLVDPVSLALPGTLPVVNRAAVEDAMMIGLALNCQIAEVTKFDRKQYTYPDLMKGYQISQYDEPICYDGWIELPTDPPHRVGINRVHMEEDVARLIHVEGANGAAMHSLLDINRAGVPLMEIVTEPDLRSAEQVEAYITSLQHIIRYLGVGTANMEEGSFRCDANVSVRPKGQEELGTKVEVKNMNRVRAVTRAIQHEIERQIKIVEDGGRITQETRGWDDFQQKTVPQRSKEFAHDYRYFPEPDIPPLEISEQWIEDVRARVPELPDVRRQRFMESWGLSEYDASLLTASRTTADYFEEIVAAVRSLGPDVRASFAKEAANWLNGEMARRMNADGIVNMYDTKVEPDQLAKLVEMFRQRELNNNSAKKVFEELYSVGGDPEEIVERLGLKIVGDESELDPIVETVLKENEGAVADYLSGKETAIRYLVGQVMRMTRGQADAQAVTELLKSKLEGIKTAG